MEPILHREAAAHGLTPDRLRHSSLAHPVDGVSITREDAASLDAICRAVQLVLAPDVVFTHITSAKLRNWWLPFIPDSPIVACTQSEAPHHNRRGAFVRRCDIPPGHRMAINGIAMASAEWTIVELAEHFGLIDLVIVIDCALHRNDTTVEAIRATMRKGRRGVRVLRRALELCDGRSESAWESALRLLFVLSGIRVEPQVVLRNANGDFIARVDLLIVGPRRVAEYDGAGHRDRDQHRDDLRREKACARLAFERFGYTEIEIRRHPELIVRDAEQALGLDFVSARLNFWNHEFESSSLSGQGRHDLLQRLSRFARATSPRSAQAASGATL